MAAEKLTNELCSKCNYWLNVSVTLRNCSKCLIQIDEDILEVSPFSDKEFLCPECYKKSKECYEKSMCPVCTPNPPNPPNPNIKNNWNDRELCQSCVKEGWTGDYDRYSGKDYLRHPSLSYPIPLSE
jgi:hypothetical protein